MKRKLELWIGWITAAMIVVFLGSFSVLVQNLTIEQYQSIFFPVFESSLEGLSANEGILLFQTLGSWFSFTVIFVLILTSLGSLFLNSRFDNRITALWYFLAGIVTLVGSQFIAFILAFPFFVTSILCLKKRKTISD